MTLGIARKFVEGADLVVTVWDGAVTAADWAEVVQGQVGDARASEGSRRLADLRTIDVSNITAADVEAVTSAFQAVEIDRSRVRFAVVVDEGWGIAQQAEEHMGAQGATTVTFNDLYAACAWLGVDAQVALTTIAELRKDLRRAAPDEPGENRT
jgi:hypothetical protein